MKDYLVKASTQVRDAVLAIVYPTACRVCGKTIESWRDGVACNECWKRVEAASRAEDFCWKCGLLLSPLPFPLQIDQRFCGRCNDCAFNFSRACGLYAGALRESVLWLKNHPQISPRLNKLLRETFQQIEPLACCDSIIPMPLHPARLAERTFNQAEVIARSLSSATGLRIDASSVVRRKKTERHRVGMGIRDRAQSLAGAFHVRAPRLIAGRSVLVIDDVMTTTSTANEIALTLLDSGAKSVSVLTLARAVDESQGSLGSR